jgi:hypothetical protein
VAGSPKRERHVGFQSEQVSNVDAVPAVSNDVAPPPAQKDTKGLREAQSSENTVDEDLAPVEPVVAAPATNKFLALLSEAPLTPAAADSLNPDTPDTQKDDATSADHSRSPLVTDTMSEPFHVVTESEVRGSEESC